jgi:hypothetical protein
MTGKVSRTPLSSYRGFNVRLGNPSPDHQPSRPSWSCGTCGRDWPCRAAQERLRAGLDRSRLAMLMWTYLEHYALDAGPGPLRGAFDRFLAWTRS